LAELSTTSQVGFGVPDATLRMSCLVLGGNDVTQNKLANVKKMAKKEKVKMASKGITEMVQQLEKVGLDWVAS
jgi:hypothetical protein